MLHRRFIGSARQLRQVLPWLRGASPTPADGARETSDRTRSADERNLGLETPPNETPRAWSTRRLIAGLMGGALLSKVLGFARELLMAQVLGASLVADGFRGASTAVLLPLIFLQNESVSATLIPIQRDAQKTGNAPQRLAALTVSLTIVAVGLMFVIQAMGALWVDAVVGGFVPEGRSLTLEFVRIMAFAMPASVMLNCLAAGEIALGRSRLTNLRTNLLNLSIMGGLVFVVVSGRVDLPAWAFAISYNLLAGWGLWSLWNEGHLSLKGLTPGMIIAAAADFLRRLRPLMALPFAEQANVWVERLMASRLGTGVVASLDYARTLTDSAALLVSQPVGMGVLSSRPSEGEQARIEAIARAVLAVTLPVSVFVLIFASEIVWVIFYRGAFSESGVVLTTQALQGIAVGLWASTLGWILLRFLNSAGRNREAAAILAAAYAMNIAVNLLSSTAQDVIGAGVLTIGFGDAIRGLILLAGTVLALQCRRRLLLFMLLAAGPAVIMAVAGWQIHQEVTGRVQQLVAGASACIACIALGTGILMPQFFSGASRRIRSWILVSTGR